MRSSPLEKTMHRASGLALGLLMSLLWPLAARTEVRDQWTVYAAEVVSYGSAVPAAPVLYQARLNLRTAFSAYVQHERIPAPAEIVPPVGSTPGILRLRFQNRGQARCSAPNSYRPTSFDFAISATTLFPGRYVLMIDGLAYGLLDATQASPAGVMPLRKFGPNQPDDPTAGKPGYDASVAAAIAAETEFVFGPMSSWRIDLPGRCRVSIDTANFPRTTARITDRDNAYNLRYWIAPDRAQAPRPEDLPGVSYENKVETGAFTLTPKCSVRGGFYGWEAETSSSLGTRLRISAFQEANGTYSRIFQFFLDDREQAKCDPNYRPTR